MATSVTYGSSWGRGQIGAAAVACITATATPDLNCICTYAAAVAMPVLWLSEARNQTQSHRDNVEFLTHWPTTGGLISIFFFFNSTYKQYHTFVFFVWLSSLSMIISRFILIAANGIVSFIFYGWVILHRKGCVCVWVYHIFFIHLSVDGHLGCF